MMEDAYMNANDQFNRLDEINIKLTNINRGQYIKLEDDIELQICMNLPEEV